MNIRLEVTWIRSGQPRPYADSYYEAIIASVPVNPEKPDSVRYFSAKQIKQLAKVLVHDFCEEGEGNIGSARLVSLVPLKSNLKYNNDMASEWRITIVSPFMD